MSDYNQPEPPAWPPRPSASFGNQNNPWPELRPAYPPPHRRTEPLAIASLVCSFGISLLGVVFGHIALSRIRRSGDGGRGLAIAGLVLGYTGIAGGILAAVLGLALISSGITMSSGPLRGSPAPSLSRLPDKGPSPANMNSNGGITLGAGGQVVPVPPSSVDASALPSPVPAAPTYGNPHAPGIEAAPKGQPAKVVVYVDFGCPSCADFHKASATTLDLLRSEGKITVEYRPVAFLDSEFTTRYPSRAAAAAACVADEHPAGYAIFMAELYAVQPARGSAGLSDQQLKSFASSAGADAAKCIDGGTYLAWARYSNRLALNSGIKGVPTAFVDGKQWGGGTSTGLSFVQFLQADLIARGGTGT
ncbi:thioredoxin domain-containing protein [Arthrobacter sp. NA-172]|uniref:thioredoxin domain-containing protein n=1 Tax=Arthrobacter sp. NA-172 TaxID=3367524 RepID=UPI0037545D83